MQIEIYLQSDNYNSLTIRENGKILAFVRGRLHDLIELLKGKRIENVVVVRGNIKEALEKISSDTEIRLIPMDINIKENEIRVKLSEVNVKDYIVYVDKYVFVSHIAKLIVSR